MVGEAEDPAPFLDSWQVPSSLTSVGQTRFRPDSCATADCSPCLRMVSNRTFSACHRFVCTHCVRCWGTSRARNGSTTCRGWAPRGVELGTGLGVFRSLLLPLDRARGSWMLGWGESGQAGLSDARAQVSPESFCELWIRDTKYVQQPCVALTVYVAMCQDRKSVV